MWETVLDALIDSAKALPFLLLIYLLIEFLERNQKAKYKTVKLLNGKLAPLVAGGVGLIPQCGFSVMATDLYCQNYLKLGTLIAFFVATSDEALPILLTNSKTVGIVWVVLAVKIVYAVALGYVINLFDKRRLSQNYDLTNSKGCCHHELGDVPDETVGSHNHNGAVSDGGAANSGCENNDHNTSSPFDDHNHEQSVCEEHGDEHEHNEHNHAHGNSKGAAFWNFVKHPLLHTAKIFLYIFAVNLVFGLLLFYAEQPILNFTSKLGFFQCFLTAAIGLVPNCASSVILTGMYSEGIVNISAMLAGLVSNSGIALAILFRQKKWKCNLGIVGIMYLAGVILGVACYFVFPLCGLA